MVAAAMMKHIAFGKHQMVVLLFAVFQNPMIMMLQGTMVERTTGS